MLALLIHQSESRIKWKLRFKDIHTNGGTWKGKGNETINFCFYAVSKLCSEHAIRLQKRHQGIKKMILTQHKSMRKKNISLPYFCY